MSKVARRLVSKQKQRLKQDGFDLDLTYITDQVIAMGLPCTGSAAIYRNPQSEVIRFLNAYHEGNFMIYNLCSRPQDQYDADKFGGNVQCFPFEDHGVPPLEMVDALARSVQSWLDVGPDRVVCVHCLAGKGRTGLMVCAALLLLGVFTTAREAMAFYGEKRMKNKKGVTQPSQRRWVEYYEQVLAARALGHPLDLSTRRLLTRIVVRDLPPKLQLSLQIEAGGQTRYDTGLFRESLELRQLCKGDFGLTLNDEEGKPMATLFLHAAFLDAPTLSCSVDWFDVNRRNKRRKHLKKATVDFVFESDGVTRCRGRTLPPTKDVGWYTAMPLDDGAGEAGEAGGELERPSFRADGLDEEVEEDEDDDEDEGEGGREAEARHRAIEDAILAQHRPMHLMPAVTGSMKNMMSGASSRLGSAKNLLARKGSSKEVG